MRIVLLIATLLLACIVTAQAQKNMVLNGDFEQYNVCPWHNDDIAASKYWSGIDSLATGWLSCIPEYCHVCADSTNDATSVPGSLQYWQWPHSGDGMGMVLVYRNDDSWSGIRDYMQGRLAKTLVPGKSYCVTFYVTLCESSRWSIKEVGAYLDNGSIDTASDCYRPQTRYTPQVTNSGGVISDSMRWTKIDGSFIATGREKFITIGNFNNNTTTTKLFMPANSYSSFFPDTSALYLIDDVSVVESGTSADAGADKIVGYGDSVYIGLPSSEVIWNSWRVLGDTSVIGEGPGIWVKPTVATQYVVTQTLCGFTTTDTVKVVVQAAGVASFNGKSQQYSLSPNPAGRLLQIQQSVIKDETQSFAIYNSMGQAVQSGVVHFNEAKTSLQLVTIPPGLYYISLKDNKGNAWKTRFVKL